jgi:hypothetical protein
MNKRIPIQAAKDVAKKFNLAQVILICWEVDEVSRNAMTHIVTYGKTKEDCLEAAQGGNKLKKALGWPENLHAAPARMKGKTIVEQAKLEEILKWARSTDLGPELRVGRIEGLTLELLGRTS